MSRDFDEFCFPPVGSGACEQYAALWKAYQELKTKLNARDEEVRSFVAETLGNIAGVEEELRLVVARVDEHMGKLMEEKDQ